MSFEDEQAQANEIAGIVIDVYSKHGEYVPLDVRYDIANRVWAAGFRRAAGDIAAERLADVIDHADEAAEANYGIPGARDVYDAYNAVGRIARGETP